MNFDLSKLDKLGKPGTAKEPAAKSAKFVPRLNVCAHVLRCPGLLR